MAAAPTLTHWLATRWARLNGPGRVAGVDLARGLAVVGMFGAHMFALPDFDWTAPATWGGVADGRSSILFATLAGVSLALVTGGSAPLAGHDLAAARGRILVRAGIIWLLGVLLVATRVPVFVILPAYAILFVLAVPFLTVPARTLFAWAAGLALVMPFVQVLLEAQPLWSTSSGAALSLMIGWHYPFPVWIAFVLCGLGIGRLDLRSWRVQIVLLVVGGTAAAVAYAFDALGGSDEAAEGASVWRAVWTARAHSSGLLEVVGSGGFAVAVIALCLLLCRTPVTWLGLPLRATGSMPLSAYTAQIVGWWVVAVSTLGDVGDIAGFRALDPFVPFTAATLACCTVWALLAGRGPLEWLVDSAARRGNAPGVSRVPR